MKEILDDLISTKGVLGCYIVDKEGIIRHIFNSQFNTRKHVEEALAEILSWE